MARGRRYRGFTMVEMVIVVGVIICLLGLLLPVLTRAREDGRRVQCLSNMRQLTTAWLAYAGDNNRHVCDPDEFVGGSVGMPGLQAGVLWNYLNNDGVYRCPADAAHTRQDFYMTSYEINLQAQGRLDVMREPQKFFVFIEAWDKAGKLTGHFGTPVYPQNTFKEGGIPGQNHHGSGGPATGTGISFADGHAIFWQYTDPRTGTLGQFIGGGLNQTTQVIGGKSVTVMSGVAPNSPDLYQLEAWSGGQVPPGASQ